MTESREITTLEDEIHQLRIQLDNLRRALNIQSARCRSINQSRRRNWHRAERTEVYCRRLEELVDAAAELISHIIGDLSHELEECGRLSQAQRLYDKIWKGDYLGEDADG